MPQEELRQETRIDSKTAEEALALAIRLQQERGETIPIEQLNQTADEAGIDRAYLAEALEQVKSKKTETVKVEASAIDQERQMRARLIVMLVAMCVSMLFALLAAKHRMVASPGMMGVFLVALVAALVAKRLRSR